MSILRLLSSSTLLVTISALIGCGGHSSQTSPATPTAYASMTIRAFDFVYDKSDLATTDIVAREQSGQTHDLLKDHALYRSSSRSKATFAILDDGTAPVTVALIARNSQYELDQIQIEVEEGAYYWIFAFGDSMSEAYSLFAQRRPEIQRVDGLVPLFIVNTNDSHGGQATSINLDQQGSLVELTPLSLSEQINLPMDLDDLAIEVKHNNEVSVMCDNLLTRNRHIYEEQPVEWKDGAWLIVVAPEGQCHLVLIYD